MKIALVTGANRGIGLEVSRQLSHHGVHVLMGSRDAIRGQQAAEELRAEGCVVEYVSLDMEDADSMHALYDLIDTKYGRLDILVNNAGIQIETDTWNVNTTSTIDMNTLRRTFDVNFFGVVQLTQIMLPLLRLSPAARIVNLSSILASLTLHAKPGSNTWNTKTFAYNSSKTALNAFTIHLAHELKDTAITVNSVHPGWVKTDMGGADATMSLADGAKSTVAAALDEDGLVNGSYHSLHQTLPW